MLFEKELSILGNNKIQISDGENSVTFITDNDQEVDAVIQYFTPIWSCKFETNTKENVCFINSRYISDFNKICKEIPFQYKKNIFYDLQGGYFFEDEYYYIVMREYKNAITIYDKRSRNITFLRNSNIVHNIHLSQLIKEPLNIIKKMDGYIQLHCSACEYNNTIILFPAQNGAGKTTLLMGMLECGGRYLGNDSLFVKAIDGVIKTKINPHAIRLGIETVEYNSTLRRKLQEKRNQINYRMINSDLYINNKIQIVPQSLSDIFSENWLGDDGNINCIVFPHLEISSLYYSIKSILPEEAISKLYECIENADHRICWLPFYDEENLKNIERKSVLDLFETLPNNMMYNLVYGGDGKKASNLIIEKIRSKVK